MKFLAAYMLVIVTACVNAQLRTDSVYALPEVEKVSSSVVIQERKIYELHPAQNLNDRLKTIEGIYIKNYGNGQLSSISFRGTSAAQTDVLWNGVKLNSPSLGQVDASLLSLGMNDNIEISRTSQTGNIGSSINLNSETPIDSSVYLGAFIAYGSFSTFRTFAKAKFSNRKVMGVSRISYMQSENDYSFLNTYKPGSPKENLTNAKVQQLHFMQQFGIRVNGDNSLHYNLWLSEAQRQIPPILSKNSSRESQDDYSLRNSLTWKGIYRKVTTDFTSAFLHDVIHYRNPDINLDANSIMQAFRNTFTLKFDSLKRIFFSLEAGYDFERAEVPSYRIIRYRHIGKLSAGLKYEPIKEISLTLKVRESIYDKMLSPFSPLVSLSYFKELHTHFFQISTTVSRNFRFATLNDMYWMPGGNPNLKTEKSWDGELNTVYKYKHSFWLKASGFCKYITDWIQWLNTGSYFEPNNVKRVLTRGAEVSVTAIVPYHRNFSVYIIAQYSYTRATNLDALSPFDQSKGKQLIYVPVNMASATLRAECKRFYVKAVNTYTGAVYIATDNSQAIQDYYLLDLEVGKELMIKNDYEIGLSFAINNVTNKQYQNVAQRPMPRINFEGTIRFQLSR